MLNRKFMPYSTQWVNQGDIDAVIKVLRTCWITQGPKIKEFEEALCRYTGARYAVAVSSGTAALHISALAAGIKGRGEVITSPITFVASANSVLYAGGRPVFADIQEDTANIDPVKIEKKITKKTKAIIPVHFAGHPCDMNKIQRIAKSCKAVVIEDAAHALGAEYKGAKIGSCRHSDMAALSFHPVKSITTGEGGAVLTNNKGLYDRLILFRNHGITKDKNKMKHFEGPWYYEMQELGFNYRITDFQCALGISQLKRLDEFIERRTKLARLYDEKLSGSEHIQLPVQKKDVKSAWHLYPVRLKFKSGIKEKRKRVFEYLQKNKIGVQIHYIPVYTQPYYRSLGYKLGENPVAEKYYASAFSLPLYPRMTKKDAGYVVNKLFQAIKDTGS